MTYYKDITAEYEDIEDRYELMVERIRSITKEETVDMRYRDYFVRTGEFLLQLDKVIEKVKSGMPISESCTAGELQQINAALYQDVMPENYETSYCNYEYTRQMFGEKIAENEIEDIDKREYLFADYLTFLCYEFHGLIAAAFEGRVVDLTVWFELFVEVYGIFENFLSVKAVKDAIYYFEHDYAEFFMDYRVREKMDPILSFATDIVMKCEDGDNSYLYEYGEYIGKNELETEAFLRRMSSEKVASIARTYTEGFRQGFVAAGIDMSKKKHVNIRYSIGMERIVKAAILQFRDMGLEPLCFRYDTNRINRTRMNRIGYVGTPVNKQMDYDHQMDQTLFLDRKLMERKLEVMRGAYEKYRYEASVYAGPACIEIFGETPFEPVSKPGQLTLSKKQQELGVEYTNELSQIVNEYIPGDEYSFTIIAYPMPEIGDDYEEIFEQIIRINNLESDVYRPVHQMIIDELDQAEWVHVIGQNGNQTDMKVSMHVLERPETETNFENCLADVNIPLGEVFTSPKLTGTHGVLNVSEVYLNDLKYVDLRLTFEDGKIKTYTCKNFDREEDNVKFVKDNLLGGRDTLPIGEFAIGTNTTAYVLANKYNMVYKLPILIVEKMGPHFAVGDTCYSWSEENILHNPDGKEIVAKDNECSILRKTDISKAYFNCHTDITIPYDEIGGIYSVHADGTKVAIIENGRFVLPGTEMLNEPFKEAK
jgi:leucyl aminopeptidase (aminopeptidase T)